MKLTDWGGYYVAENAVVVGDVRLAKGVSVWYHAVIRGDMAPITIGEYTNIQDGCILHCDPGEDLVVGAYVTVGHQAVLHGRRIGDRCLIGINAIILGRAEVGDGCLIAAGALVREDQKVPPRSIVVGVPGRIIGQLTDGQLAEFEDRAQRYYATARRHVTGKVDPKRMKEHGS